MNIPTPSGMFTSVTRLRRSGEYDADTGEWTPGDATEATISASVQPATQRDLLRVPEGYRTRSLITVLSPDELQSGNETDGLLPDRVEHLDEEYEVVAVERFVMGTLDHYDAVAVRVDREGVTSDEA